MRVVEEAHGAVVRVGGAPTRADVQRAVARVGRGAPRPGRARDQREYDGDEELHVLIGRFKKRDEESQC